MKNNKAKTIFLSLGGVILIGFTLISAYVINNSKNTSQDLRGLALVSSYSQTGVIRVGDSVAGYELTPQELRFEIIINDSEIIADLFPNQSPCLPTENELSCNVWTEDSVEWFVDLGNQDNSVGALSRDASFMREDDFQGVVNLNGAKVDLRGTATNKPGFAWNGAWTAETSQNQTGGSIVITIPWTSLGVADLSQVGRNIGIGFARNDVDSTQSQSYLWGELGPSHQNAANWTLLAVTTNTPPTPTASLVPTASPTNAPQPTNTPTLTPTNTPQPTSTPVPSPTNTPSPTVAPTFTPIPTATPTNTPSPTSTPTPTATPTNTPQPTNTPTLTPTNTPQPTSTPVPTPTQVPGCNANPDLNQDGDIDIIDLQQLIQDFFSQGDDLASDLNCDMAVDIVDYQILILRFEF